MSDYDFNESGESGDAWDDKPKRGESGIDPKKPIVASRVLRKPEFFANPLPKYIMLINDSGNPGYQNLLAAINLLAEMRWEAVGITVDSSGRMLALLKRSD